MAINLSDLTGAATSGNILAEVQSTADFLDSVPLLKNLADPSGATDAKQFTATNQPTALPLIDGDGYLYSSGINGNYARTPDDASLDITGDLVIDVDVTMKSWSPTYNSSFCGKYITTNDQRSFRFVLRTDKRLNVYISDDGTAAGLASATSPVVPFSDNQRGQVRMSFNSSTGIIQFFTSTDKGYTWAQLGSDASTGKTSIYSSTTDVYVGAYNHNAELLDDAAIHSVKFYDSITPSSSSLRFNCDFTFSNVRHGATKFECATGQVVTINQSGNNPATLIRIPSLRFDGVDDWYSGLFDSAIAGGRLFAAFTVLGDGGNASGRVFCAGTAYGTEFATDGAMWLANSEGASRSYFEGLTRMFRAGGFTGTHIHEVLLSGSAHKYLLDGGSELTDTTALTIAPTRFGIGAGLSGGNPVAIDLHELILTPPDITESAATTLRNYINNRLGVY